MRFAVRPVRFGRKPASDGDETDGLPAFFRSHNGDLWSETVDELRRRGQSAACCPCQAKVMALAFADGTCLAIEGSANLCSNGSAREQFAIVHDAGIHRFHATWISQLVDRHEAHQNDAKQAT